jgi:transglutaminase-like putative cysteine protease
MAIPFVEPWFLGDPTLDPRLRRVAEGAGIGLRLVLFVFLCAAARRPEYALPAVLLLLQSAFLTRSAFDPLAVLTLATALLQGGLAAITARGAPSLLLFGLQLGVTMVAGVLVHARASRRRVLRATVHRLRVPDETTGRLGRRVAYGVGVALLVSALTIALDGAVQSLRRDPRIAQRAARELGAEESDSTRGESSGRGPGARFPRELDLSPSIDPLGADRVLEVTLHGPGGEDLGDRGAILLEGMHLDRFTEAGLDLALDGDPELVRDGDDGSEDGWILLAVPEGQPGEPFTLRVTQGVLELGPAGEAPLFRPEPAFAVAIDEALVSPGGWLSTTGPEGLLRYEVASAFVATGLDALAGVPARHSDPLYVGLPPESDDLAFVRARASAVCSGAQDDAARVALVLRHFKRDYRYSFEASGFQGIAGLRDFLERREGFCTWFASAAVLLLRCEGVPARVATGYRCREWSLEEERYVVRERDGHAWIEVFFEGHGWLCFDPTPQAAVDRALEELFGTGEDRDLSSWYDDLTSAIAAWTDPDDEGGSLRAIVRALYELPGALLASARTSRIAAAALFVVPALVFAWLLRRRLARVLERAGVRPPGEPVSTFYWHRLLRALAKRGHVKRKGETPREFARAAIARAGEELAPLERVVDLYYRDRFAGAPLDEDERRFVAEFTARVGA